MNQLTSLPSFPSNLRKLYCEHNQLTSLPSLPSSLQYLYCYNNQLTSLPILPFRIKNIYFINNPFSIETSRLENETPHDYWNRLEEVQSKKRIIKRTRELKEGIMMKYWHPTNVQKLLDHYGIDFEDCV
jgi:hypothetical protein